MGFTCVVQSLDFLLYGCVGTDVQFDGCTGGLFREELLEVTLGWGGGLAISDKDNNEMLHSALKPDPVNCKHFQSTRHSHILRSEMKSHTGYVSRRT